jgi:hypothetical protein
MFRFLCICAVLPIVVACFRQRVEPVQSREPVLPIDTAAVTSSSDSVREYRGEWESEFESSVFRQCDVKIPGSTWLQFAANVRPQFPPRANVVASNNYYVRVLGILRGPADRRQFGAGFGHGNGSDYELYVTRILELKLPDETTCSVPR